ncbi:MAG: metallophosphoesterase family protein [Kiritimatiellia bacterium]
MQDTNSHLALFFESIRACLEDETVSKIRLSGSCLPCVIGLLLLLLFFPGRAWAMGPFRVLPYLQNPATNAVTVIWFSEADTTGQLAYGLMGNWMTVDVPAVLASVLDYHSTENQKFPGNIAPSIPYSHCARLTGLSAGTSYTYAVTQDGVSVTNTFRTAPLPNRSVRFVVYADSETEPESTGAKVTWPQLGGSSSRLYVVDQTCGYQENLLVMKARAPDFIVIAGDLAQAGGEQRDWDEFWRHNAGDLGTLASTVPIMPALGNHEYYGGTRGSYNQPSSEQSVAKYLTYFEMPPNNAANPAHEKRYYRMDYGPITLVVLDLCNGDDTTPAADTSTYLKTSDGCQAPDFNPGTPQYVWLEAQLALAQLNSRFTFVAFHQAPYSVGPHGAATESQSGVPVRVLTPLFLQYGVDALLCGHDEMYEHSVVAGVEQLPGGGTCAATLHVYDLGMGGDGLRGPTSGVVNDKQVFLAHSDAPETWLGARLVSGGKHYGHLEVNVQMDAHGGWEAVLTPAYAFPLMDSSGNVISFERRAYDDEVILKATVPLSSQPRGSVVIGW